MCIRDSYRSGPRGRGGREWPASLRGGQQPDHNDRADRSDEIGRAKSPPAVPVATANARRERRDRLLGRIARRFGVRPAATQLVLRGFAVRWHALVRGGGIGHLEIPAKRTDARREAGIQKPVVTKRSATLKDAPTNHEGGH